MVTIKGPHSPTIFIDGNNKTWLVSGHVWKSVTAGTTLKDVKYIPPVAPKVMKLHEVVREFLSARDARIKYVTVIRNDGAKSCTCSGYTYRRFCKHIESVTKELGWK